MTTHPSSRDPIRRFADRSFRRLLASRFNAHGLLSILAPGIARETPEEAMEPDPTSFVDERFRERESDVLYRIRGSGRETLFYILYEHQSTEDADMSIRLLLYMGRIWADWWERAPADNVRRPFPPIVPAVIYTGEKRWKRTFDLRKTTGFPRRLHPYVPAFRVLFLPVKFRPRRSLVAAGHPFGWVLSALRAESMRAPTLGAALREAAARLDPLAASHPAVWRGYVDYFMGLVYYRRKKKEHAVLLDALAKGIGDPALREEVMTRGKSYAEELFEEGIEKGIEKGRREELRESLLRLVRRRFQAVPADVAAEIGRTDDIDRLRSWLDTATLAREIGEIDFASLRAE